MKYEKPEVVQVGSAELILGGAKVHGCILDGNEPLQTCGAYEADVWDRRRVLGTRAPALHLVAAPALDP